MATTPMQGFTRAVTETAEDQTLDFFLKTTDGVDEEGNEIVYRYDEFHASRPSEEQMMFLLANGMRRDATLADEASAIFDLLRDVLPPQEYKVLERRFKDPKDTGVGYQVLGDLFEWMMEEWTLFPTQSHTGSSTSQARTGGNSKGRVRGPGSTSSRSR
jgi:hypothetical protein